MGDTSNKHWIWYAFIFQGTTPTLTTVNVLVSSIVHHFFAFRIWKLTSKIWPVVIISAVSIVQLLFSIKTGQIVRVDIVQICLSRLYFYFM